MHDEDSGNIALIEKLYTSFAKLDAEGMASCYHKDIHFLDPAFGNLHNEEVSKMWEMLIKRSKGNLEITYSDIWIDEDYGGAKWTAKYKFGSRTVINHVIARFKISDGKIIEHSDDFNVWKWSRQALGPIGWLFGWSGFVANSIRKKSRKLLEEYQV